MRRLFWTSGIGVLLWLGLASLSRIGWGEDAPAEKIGGKLYVTSWFGDWISVIDLDAGKVTAEIKVGMKDHNVFLTPDQKFAWVTNNNSNTVSIIETATDKVINTLQVGKGPRHTFFSGDGSTAYVTTEFDDSVMVVDPAKGTVLTKVRVG